MSPKEETMKNIVDFGSGMQGNPVSYWTKLS